MRYSRQREQIYSWVVNNPCHPTANTVYTAIKKELPSLSLGTVYRNLNQLAEAGKLKKIPMPDGSDRFDGTVEEHFHIVCSNCGRVADVTPLQGEQLPETVTRETGFRLDSYELIMRGTCKDCIKKNTVGGI